MSSTPHTYRRRVAFSETDMAGVMHFSNYYRWMEEAEHDFWRSLGRSVWHFGDNHDISWPRVRTACEYYAPARFDDEITVHTRLLKVGGKSLEYEFEFRRGDQRLARGETTCVCCEVRDDGFRSIAIPDEIRSLLTPHVAACGK
jgi:acyl-CoA thioester hydrolase